MADSGVKDIPSANELIPKVFHFNLFCFIFIVIFILILFISFSNISITVTKEVPNGPRG